MGFPMVFPIFSPSPGWAALEIPLRWPRRSLCPAGHRVDGPGPRAVSSRQWTCKTGENYGKCGKMWEKRWKNVKKTEIYGKNMENLEHIGNIWKIMETYLCRKNEWFTFKLLFFHGLIQNDHSRIENGDLSNTKWWSSMYSGDLMGDTMDDNVDK